MALVAGRCERQLLHLVFNVASSAIIPDLEVPLPYLPLLQLVHYEMGEVACYLHVEDAQALEAAGVLENLTNEEATQRLLVRLLYHGLAAAVIAVLEMAQMEDLKRVHYLRERGERFLGEERVASKVQLFEVGEVFWTEEGAVGHADRSADELQHS